MIRNHSIREIKLFPTQVNGRRGRKVKMDTFSAESTKPLLLVSLVALPTPSLLCLVCLSVAFSPSHIGSFSS